MAYCKNCGNKLEDGAKFCPKCGTPSGSETKQDTETKQEKSSKKGELIAAIVVMAAIALGGAAWFFLGNQQDKYSLEGLAKAAVNYDYIDDFHDGMAMVTKGEKIGFIDRMGNEVIPCIYDFMEDTDCSFNDGLAFVRQGDSTFFINKEGKKPFEFKYDAANHFSEGLAVVWKDGKSGYIDTHGKEVIALTDKYSYDNFSEGLAAVSQSDKYGFIDKNGNIVIPIKYEVQSEMGETSSFHEGLAMIINNGKCGFIDTKGTEVISCKYDNASDFSEGLSCVMKGEKYGYIDKSGKEIIPFVFDSAGSFSEGFAIVNKGDKDYFINKEGNEAFSCAYDGRLENFHNGLAVVTNYREGDFIYGVIDTSGKEIVPCKYAYMGTFSEGLTVVSLDGEIYGFIDKNGNSTFDVQNEEVKKIVDAKLQEKEEKRIQEEAERKAEEERVEAERRRGIDKVVTLSFTRREDGSVADISGNYGANVWKGMWKYDGYVMTDFISIPNGKVWLFERWEKVSGSPGTIWLLYNSRDSNTEGIRYYDHSYEVQSGDLPILRARDKIRLAFNPYHDSGTKTIKVYFKEKDEDVIH